MSAGFLAHDHHPLCLSPSQQRARRDFACLAAAVCAVAARDGLCGGGPEPGTSQMPASVQFPALRSADDFLTGSARFALPEAGNWAKWRSRVVRNLQYYQSNYFLMVVAVFLVVGCLQPVRMVAGALAVGSACGGLVWARRHGEAVRLAQRHNPGGVAVALALCSLALCHLVGGLLFFLSGIALPVLLVILHASLRLRNIKNKVSNQMELLGVKRTPMGLLLEALGQNLDPQADDMTEAEQRYAKSR